MNWQINELLEGVSRLGDGGGEANLNWSPDSNLIVHKAGGGEGECEPARQKLILNFSSKQQPDSVY